MIKDITKLNRGGYVADYRFDEGIRIREEFISPCLTSSLTDSGDKLDNNSIFLVIVNEDKRSDQEGVCRSD